MEKYQCDKCLLIVTGLDVGFCPECNKPMRKIINTSPKELPKGLCPSCWGKKFNSVMTRQVGYPDFPGDKGFDTGSYVENIPCSKCNGTGLFPSPKEEVKYKENINCDNAIVEIDSPKEEVSKCCESEICFGKPSGLSEYNGLYCSNCRKPIESPSPKVSEWETEFDEKFTHMGKNQADQLDRVWNGMVTITSMKKFISSLLSSTEKRVAKETRCHYYDLVRKETAKEVANEIIGELESVDITLFTSKKCREDITNLIKSKYE